MTETQIILTNVRYIFLNVAPCMLLHLLYNPTHAVFTH